ncbi:hypothetical protein PGTUg99_034401 [Puccinia graminis f. sp. tritici]|uniref:Uncharacterized protein n=1 Tax=Puccinia graminis f. sp. tritici TaxID=56615 RepID=A0A5B0NI44_PUCGR|nr:hypothetical protein PGTUg99_034401 [Puccinia graminis f. sp. tritici]
MWAKMGQKAPPSPTKLPWATPEAFHSLVTTIIAVIKPQEPSRNSPVISQHPKSTILSAPNCPVSTKKILKTPLDYYYVSVNLQENAELIQRYLIILRLRKEESERNYQPTPWERLTKEEQLLLATYHAHIHQEEDLEEQINFRNFLREIRAKNKILHQKRYQEKMSTFEVGRIRTERSSPTPSVDTDNGDSDQTAPSQIVPNYEAPSQLRQDLVAAKELRARVENLQMTTLVRKETATVVKEKSKKNEDLLPSTETETPMDVDEIESASSEVTPTRPSTPEIRVLSKEEQIRLRVKEHVSLWKRCQVAAREGPTPTLRALLTEAQESQKTLQKLINNEEIESYVKGWNPWDEKKIHFPAPPKKQTMKFKKNEPGKRQSSSSINFADPAKWRKATELLQIAAGLYQNMQ